MIGGYRTALGFLLTIPFWIHAAFAASSGDFPFPTSLEAKLAGRHSTQCLVVLVENASATSARIFPFEKKSTLWSSCLSPIAASIGRNGLAEGDSKREGDGKTPAGVFPLGLVFGYASSVNFAMPYRQATEDDIWVDDAASPDYNQWISQKTNTAASFEKMKRPDDLYKWGVVIEYNTDPIVKGKGSAIFFHLWSGPGASTSGCVAIAESDMERVLSWLDPAKKPFMAIGVNFPEN